MKSPNKPSLPSKRLCKCWMWTLKNWGVSWNKMTMKVEVLLIWESNPNNLRNFVWLQIRALLGERVHERTEQWRNNTNSRLLREIKDPSTLHEAFQFLVRVCIEDKDIAGINKLIVGNTWTRAGSKVGKAGIIAKAVIRKWRLSKP